MPDSRERVREQEYNRTYRKIRPSVYAAYFPSAGILKVGFSTTTQYVQRASGRVRERFGLDADNGESIWLKPGDQGTEAFIQAYLAKVLRWPQPESNGSRHSEWFKPPTTMRIGIVHALNNAYALIPQPVSEAA